MNLAMAAEGGRRNLLTRTAALQYLSPEATGPAAVTRTARLASPARAATSRERTV